MPYRFSQTAEELQNITDVGQDNIALEYDESTSYAVGNYCVHGGGLYRCTAATSGAWNASKWTEITVMGEVATDKAAIAENAGDISSLNATLSNLYYKSGDTINGSIAVTGYITSGSSQLILDFALPKLIPSTARMTLSAANFQYVRLGYGGYLPNVPALANVTSVSEKWGLMRIVINNFATGATNNCAVGGEITITGTFN